MNSFKTGYYSSLILAFLTLITFAFALTAIPNSGAFCQENCFEYPYHDSMSEFPGDYYWMFLACIMLPAFMAFVLAHESIVSPGNMFFFRVASAMSIIAVTVLTAVYFVQFTVVPSSLLHGETEGIAMITQYNPHGTFIALEEYGYIFMGISFVFLAIVFEGKGLPAVVRWIYISAFVLIVVGFIITTLLFGMVRKDRFEVFVISVTWLVLIINGFLSARYFRRKMKAMEP
jgi:hypothetical protein